MATCTASVPNLDTSGDNLYAPRICWQPFIDWAWEAFDFDKGDWDDGFGYDQVCDNTRPLCRTLSGIWCLTYSSPNFPSESYSSNILEWGCRFARNAIDELDARCGSGAFIAYTWWGPIIDNRTELYLTYFYGWGVSMRAGTLIHEARHADGKGHDSGNNDSSWGYNGAWRWEVCWLAWFAAAGTSTSVAMRTQATQRANNIINSNFDTHPGFNV
ncbi:MAG: hypothetical protein HYT78_06335 [Deltaproteobacteria bacterium]|nr:hypothetical protein [Deltaproteobacteria bacterium]